MQFPILSVIIFTPLLAGIILLLLPADRKTLFRRIALAAATITLALSVVVYASYDIAPGGTNSVRSWPGCRSSVSPT